jgi:selenide,water dikinase
VGPRTSDDAAVYLLEGGPALVQTLDVITPVVDDPGEFGAIAAANALSDVWAMGGTPVTALSLLAFDPCRVPLDTARAILAGALPVLEEAGCALVGGHTLDDPELKFGLAVTGVVDPARITRNSTARPGDLLYLTKPLGTGVVATALKGGLAPAPVVAEATRWMKTPNSGAARAARAAGASAVTDVTGFGLLGHLLEMCRGAGVGAKLEGERIPVMKGVPGLVEAGMVPAGAYANRKAIEGFLAGGAADGRLLTLCDPQTSGGFLIAVPTFGAAAHEAALEAENVFFARVGRFVPPPIIIALA